MDEKLSLTELQLIIRDSLYTSLPDFYWVIAEISEIKENLSGHCYLELIEKLPDDKNVRARVKAVIWSKRYRFLKPFFENMTGESLREGMKILVRVKIEYHEIYGLSLVISDLDPSYTTGEMAIKRQMIIKRLEEEGVFTMNRELEFPVLPQRIAIVSSKNAAGYTDFVRHLKGNSQRYVFYTALFDTIMQGTETEKSVISSLSRIADMPDLFDVVAIIRGGGSQSDLSWFDNYNIAFYVTQFPIPVLTGIGHEKDMSVTDLVAFTALKTPTAVAGYLIDCLSETENYLKAMGDDITEFSGSVIEYNRNLMDSLKSKLLPASRLLISDWKEKVSDSIIELINFGKEYILKAEILPANQTSKLVSATGSFILNKKGIIDRNRLSLMNRTFETIYRLKERIRGEENSLSMLDPANVLKRGYTITTKEGMIIKNSGQLTRDDQIETIFSDGKIKSQVTENIKVKR
jgi:exodeoxyribonuclease VII large subunit